jgi:branched-chain amino acid transport system permease protein
LINFIVFLLTIIGIYGILSLSLSIQYGTAGLVNFAVVAFFMIGAYASAILVVLFHMPIYVGFVVAIAGGAIFGLLLTLPVGKLRQHYWAIVTLAAAHLVRLVFLNTQLGGPYVGGSYGVTNIPGPLDNVLSGDAYDWFYLGLVAVCLAVAYAVTVWVTRAPFGRVLKALREGDDIPYALGKRVRSMRLRAMAIGGGMAGAAGSLYAHFNGFIAPTFFLPLETFLVWSMVILGGSGNHRGALVGTVIIELLYNSTRFLPGSGNLLASLRMVLIGTLIIVIIIYLPQGVLPERKRVFPERKRAYGQRGSARS